MQIQAAIGAKEAVQHCGGVAWIWKAVGCQFKPLNSNRSDMTHDDHSDSLYFDLARYEDVVAPLKNTKRLKMRLLSNEGEISKLVQDRFRSALLLPISIPHKSFEFILLKLNVMILNLSQQRFHECEPGRLSFPCLKVWSTETTCESELCYSSVS